jgi:PAS domain S-box-containing protein
MPKPLLNILLIEDDPDDAVLIRSTLREVLGVRYALEWSREYDEGISRLRNGEFDAALVDYRLGERDGLQFIHDAISHGVSIPLILLTGQDTRSLDLDAIGAGASDFLSKLNLSPDILERSIRYAVQRRKSEQDRLGFLREQAGRERAEAAAEAVREYALRLEAEIAERKRVESALRQSEANFRSLADAMPQIVWASAADGTPQYLNRRWYEYTGLGEDQSFDAEIRRKVAHPDDLEPTARLWERSLQTGEPLQMEIRLRHHAGKYRWHLVRAVPIRDENGRIIRWFGTSTDIDDHKRAEHAVAEHARRLAASNAELESFAYVASHDLKEPLRGISAYADMLLEDLGPVAGPPERDKLETLVRLCTRMYELLDSLLELSRVGRADVALASTNLNEVVKDCLGQLVPRLEKDQVHVEVGELPTLVCDRVRVTQVFSNLIVNAIKYNTKDHKKIEIGVLPGEPVVGEAHPRAENPPVLFVRDNGIGISTRHHDAVFRVFRRLHARDAFGGGTGVGLSIVKKIIQHHGGRIWLESTPGEGTTFYFTLAAAEPGHGFASLLADRRQDVLPSARAAGLIGPRRTSTVGGE